MRLLVGSVEGQYCIRSVDAGKAVNLTAAVPGVGSDLTTPIGDSGLMARAEEVARGGNSGDAELMVIIGKGGRQIAEADALRHVSGHAVSKDGPVRDYQRKTHRWTPGKNRDETGAIGRFVVTPDELPEGTSGLKNECGVGDENPQRTTAGNVHWSVAQAVATIFDDTSLRPGDHIALGSPSGVGQAGTPEPRWLKPGEVVSIEGIGICTSPISTECDTYREAAE